MRISDWSSDVCSSDLSHDGSSSYQMLAGMFRFVCQNGLVCGDTFADVRVPHKGNVTDHVIEGAYEVLDGFERVQHSRDAVHATTLHAGEAELFARPALTPKSHDMGHASGRQRVCQYV